MTTQEQTDPVKQFPRGFDSWRQAHFEVSSFIQKCLSEEHPGYIQELNDRHGCRTLSDEAQRWTDEFEQKYKDQDWEKLDWLETILEFCEEKNQPS